METRDKDPLADARGQIDQLDQELVRLLAERMNAVREIGAAKGDNPEEILLLPALEDEEPQSSRAVDRLFGGEVPAVVGVLEVSNRRADAQGRTTWKG